jgi:hypothetical protein
MDINFLAVGLAAFAAFFLGFLWYTIIFAKPWQKEIGLSTDGTVNKDVQPPNLGRLLVGSFILEVIMAVIMSASISRLSDWSTGLGIGLIFGLAVSCSFGVNYLFEGKSFKHWLINASYNVVVFAVMGLIIGAL